MLNILFPTFKSLKYVKMKLAVQTAYDGQSHL